MQHEGSKTVEKMVVAKDDGEGAVLSPMTKRGPRITITLTPEEFHDVHNLAFRSSSSVSQIAQLAIVRLLLDAETGKLPLLPEYRRGIDPGNA